jgi:hypothetical protein
MVHKPRQASDHRREQVEYARGACRHIAAGLGDLMDEVVVVSGLIRTLLIDHVAMPGGTSAHVGTVDLDNGLELAPPDESRHRTLTKRPRSAGFVEAILDAGHGR